MWISLFHSNTQTLEDPKLDGECHCILPTTVWDLIHHYVTGGTVAKLCDNTMRRCRNSTCISFNAVCKEYECLTFICFPHQYFLFTFQQDPLCVAMNYSHQNILQTQGLPSYVLNILFQKGNINKLSDLGWREQRFILIMTVL